MIRGDIMRFVVIPQGALFAVPALMGFAILIFQATALTVTIAVPELWRAPTASERRPISISSELGS